MKKNLYSNRFKKNFIHWTIPKDLRQGRFRNFRGLPKFQFLVEIQSKLLSSVCVVYSGFEFTFVASDTKNSHRLKSGRLIKKYLEFEPRILDVAKVIRQWAEWCRLDRADEVSFKGWKRFHFRWLKMTPLFLSR